MKNKPIVPGNQFEVVIVAASAGGLPTLIRLLAPISRDFPAALIYVQHQAPHNPSPLADILARKSHLAVRVVQNLDTIIPGTLFVAPPDQHLLVDKNRQLMLTQAAPVHFQRPSIDLLLESAAQSLQDRVAVVILSGMGDDGSQGVMAVKSEGGLIIVEDPTSALYPGMPEAAIRTGSVDFILPVDQIGYYLIQLFESGEKA